MKRLNDDLSVPTGGCMNPSMARWEMRGMDDFTVEELARLQQKLEGWIRQRAPQTERTRRRPWVMQPKTTHLA